MTTLLSSRIMQRSTKHSLVQRRSVRGMHKGERRSSKHGTSLEFSDFRIYTPGDDPRLIDWNAFARTQKHYIKRYLDEQELFVTIYLDGSKSMMIPIEKWEMAKSITACLGYMSLVNDDRISVFPVGTGSTSFTYKKGRAYAGKLVNYMTGLKPAGAAVPVHFQPASEIYNRKETASASSSVISWNRLKR